MVTSLDLILSDIWTITLTAESRGRRKQVLKAAEYPHEAWPLAARGSTVSDGIGELSVPSEYFCDGRPDDARFGILPN